MLARVQTSPTPSPRLAVILNRRARGCSPVVVDRLARIVRPDTRRTVMLAVDHGYFMGPTTRLEAPVTTIAPLLPFVDSLMLTRGVLRQAVPAAPTVPIVLRVSGGTSILASDLSNEGVTTTVKEALRLNAAAVALSIFVGSPHEHQTLLNLSTLVSEAEEYGVPVLAVTALGQALRPAGFAAEIGAGVEAALAALDESD